MTAAQNNINGVILLLQLLKFQTNFFWRIIANVDNIFNLFEVH